MTEPLEYPFARRDQEAVAEAEPEPEPDAEPEVERESEVEAEAEPVEEAEPEPQPLLRAPEQHAAGELEIPEGYAVLEGAPDGARRGVAVVVARFNGEITSRLLES